MKKKKRLLIIAGSVSIIMIIIIVSLLTILNKQEKKFVQEEDVVVRISDVEKMFGRLEDYQRSDEETHVQSLRFITERKGKNLDIGTQIITEKTQEDTKNIFEMHLHDILQQEGAIQEQVPVGSKGTLIKVPLSTDGSLYIFYLLFYKDMDFIIITLNYAIESDEDGIIKLAETIDKRLD